LYDQPGRGRASPTSPPSCGTWHTAERNGIEKTPRTKLFTRIEGWTVAYVGVREHFPLKGVAIRACALVAVRLRPQPRQSESARARTIRISPSSRPLPGTWPARCGGVGECNRARAMRGTQRRDKCDKYDTYIDNNILRRTAARRVAGREDAVDGLKVFRRIK